MDTRLVSDNHFMVIAFDLIGGAKQSVDISSYKFQPPTLDKNKKINILFNIIAMKRKEGVKVRLLLNLEQPIRGVSRHNLKTASLFTEKGVRCRYLYNNRCCHSKIILVDGIHYYLGSHNFSEHSISRNFETGVCGSDPTIARDMVFAYERVWASGVDFFERKTEK